MGENQVVQTGASDAVRIPKWALGCAIGFSVACVLLGAVLGGIWLLTPSDTASEAGEVASGSSQASDSIIDAVRESIGNSGPKLSSPVALEDFEFPPPGAGDDSAVSFVFYDPQGNDLVWKITLTHPDATFQDGVYTMDITGQNLKGYSGDSCQVKSGRLTCSFTGRSPRFSEASVKVAVTRENRVVTSFWGRVSERRGRDGSSGQAGAEDEDAGQASGGQKDELCTVNEEGYELVYGGTVSRPMVSETWEAGKPLKIEFDLSDEAGTGFPTATDSYYLAVGEYSTVECDGRNANKPNRLTCEIELPEGYGHSVQGIILAFVTGIDDEENAVAIGMCEDLIEIPEMTGTVAAAGGDHDDPASGIDCSALDYDLQWGEIDIAWPEWKSGQPLPITFKFPGPVPGLEEGSSYYQYSVKVSDPLNGENAYYDHECEYLGYTGKLHCYVPVSSGWAGSIKEVELSVAGCGPIYWNSQESLPFIKGGGGGTDDHHDDHDDDDHHH